MRHHTFSMNFIHEFFRRSLVFILISNHQIHVVIHSASQVRRVEVGPHSLIFWFDVILSDGKGDLLAFFSLILLRERISSHMGWSIASWSSCLWDLILFSLLICPIRILFIQISQNFESILMKQVSTRTQSQLIMRRSVLNLLLNSDIWEFVLGSLESISGHIFLVFLLSVRILKLIIDILIRNED